MKRITIQEFIKDFKLYEKSFNEWFGYKYGKELEISDALIDQCSFVKNINDIANIFNNFTYENNSILKHRLTEFFIELWKDNKTLPIHIGNGTKADISKQLHKFENLIKENKLVVTDEEIKEASENYINERIIDQKYLKYANWFILGQRQNSLDGSLLYDYIKDIQRGNEF